MPRWLPERAKIVGSLRRLAVWLMLLAIWEGAYRVVGWKDWVFPAPSHVLDDTFAMLNVDTLFGATISPSWPRNPEASTRALPPWYASPLAKALAVSTVRLATGFSISILLGMFLGAAMWQWKWLDDFLGPLFLGLQTLPSVCWVPLAVLLLGLNEQGILFVIVAGSFFAIAIAMRDGLRTIPPLYQRAGLMMGASGLKLYRYVLLPASLPAMSSSLRQGFAFAWRSLLGAELILVVQHHGLGFLLETGRNFSDVGQVIAVMIIMVMIGMAVDRWVFAKLHASVHRRFGLA